MKGPKGKTPDFRIPLSTEARRVVDIALAESKSGYLFANDNHGTISNLGINYPLQRAKSPATLHGFRTTLSGWMQVNTDAPFEIREWTLAHKVGGSVAAYMPGTEPAAKRVRISITPHLQRKQAAAIQTQKESS